MRPGLNGRNRFAYSSLRPMALKIDQENIDTQVFTRRPRFDPRQIDLAVGQLAQNADERARPVVGDGERDRCLIIPARPRVRSCKSEKPRLVMLHVLDRPLEDHSAIESRRSSGANSSAAGRLDSACHSRRRREGLIREVLIPVLSG